MPLTSNLDWENFGKARNLHSAHSMITLCKVKLLYTQFLQCNFACKLLKVWKRGICLIQQEAYTWKPALTYIHFLMTSLGPNGRQKRKPKAEKSQFYLHLQIQDLLIDINKVYLGNYETFWTFFLLLLLKIASRWGLRHLWLQRWDWLINKKEMLTVIFMVENKTFQCPERRSRCSVGFWRGFVASRASMLCFKLDNLAACIAVKFAICEISCDFELYWNSVRNAVLNNIAAQRCCNFQNPELLQADIQ